MWRLAWRHGEALPALILHHRNASGSNSAQAGSGTVIPLSGIHSVAIKAGVTVVSPNTTGRVILTGRTNRRFRLGMTTSTTNHTSVTGPDQNRFGILGTNIVVRLLAYYLAIGAVSWLVPRMLPGSLRELLRQATTPLLGLAPTSDVLVGTPDPTIAALPPVAVIFMGIIAVVSAVLLCLPVSWTYMFTRQKKGYSQTIVHTLLLLPLVVAMVATLVRSSVALAFSLAGIVAAVRFRVALEDSRDAVFVFAVMALGLASGVQLEIAAGALGALRHDRAHPVVFGLRPYPAFARG
jgi:hypothetical protein